MTDWEGIVRDEGPAVWRTAQRLLGNAADADECFQETFAAAVELVRRKTEPVRQLFPGQLCLQMSWKD